MTEETRKEIDAIVRRGKISKEDIGLDLDTRENYPGEFYILGLMHVSTDDLREYYNAMP